MYKSCRTPETNMLYVTYIPPQKERKIVFAELQGQGDAQLAGSGWCERS